MHHQWFSGGASRELLSHFYFHEAIKILLEIEIEVRKIYQDNTTTINMVKQDGLSERSKHIDVKFNFVKRLVRDKLVVCPHIATKQMVADIFTKDLPDEDFGGHSNTVHGRLHC